MHNVPMNKRPLIASLAVLSAAVCLGQTSPGLVVAEHGKIDWKASGSLPPGAEYHLINEDPKTHAVQILARFKARYVLASHHHTHDETIVVVRGKLGIQTETAKTVLGPGSYAKIPAHAPHTLRAAGWGGCEILVIMTGPYDARFTQSARSEIMALKIIR